MSEPSPSLVSPYQESSGSSVCPIPGTPATLRIRWRASRDAATFTLLDVSQELCERLGFSKSELRIVSSTAFGHCLTPDLFERVHSPFWKDRGINIETDFRTRPGAAIPVQVHSKPVSIGDHSAVESFISELNPIASGQHATNDRRPGWEQCAFTRPGRRRLFGWNSLDPNADSRAGRTLEAALNASENQFRAVVESSLIGILIHDGSLITYLNALAADMLGALEPSRCIGQPIGRFIASGCDPEIRRNLEQLNVSAQEIPPTELSLLRLDGTGFEVELSGKSFSYCGKPSGLLFFRDITPQRQLQLQLRQAAKMEAVGQLASGVAHDFNNMLAAVLLYLGLMRARHSLPLDLKESLLEVETEVSRAANLTRQLLVFSRRDVPRFSPVDANSLITNLLKMLRRLLGENIVLTFAANPSDTWINGDAGMIEHVITNLCINSRDAMPAGGTLEVSTSVVNHDASSGKTAGTYACITVKDSGCGMSRSVMERAYEPFFTTKESSKGTGLGLATVYGIVVQHSGWIDLHSEVGKGTEFRVFLPLVDRAAPASAVPQNKPQISGGSETILFVEDDRAVRRAAALSLRSLGYAVIEAGDATEALDASQRHRGISLLLTDHVMPGSMTGRELASILKRQDPRLKVIISSGYNDPSTSAAPNNTDFA